MIIHEIGETAGRIWQELSRTGSSPVGDLSRKLGGDPQLVHLALGWLSREDKLSFEGRGKAMVVRLKEAAVPDNRR